MGEYSDRRQVRTEAKDDDGQGHEAQDKPFRELVELVLVMAFTGSIKNGTGGIALHEDVGKRRRVLHRVETGMLLIIQARGAARK